MHNHFTGPTIGRFTHVRGWIYWPSCAGYLCGPANPFPAEQEDPETSHTRQWDFDSIAPGTLPSSFVIGTLFDGRPAGEWKILITDRAKSPSQVLAQLQPKGTDQAHKLLLMEGTDSGNIDVEVSYLAVAGKADFGGGLVWHATDDRNYYLLRASSVEQKVQALSRREGGPANRQAARPPAPRKRVAQIAHRTTWLRAQSPL
jgi:hypothetical protein